MNHSQQDLEALLAECVDVNRADYPVEHVMPNFDVLADEWLNQESVPNSHIMDEFSIWSDVISRDTYAILKAIGGFFRSEVVFVGNMSAESPSAPQSNHKVCIAGYRWEQDGTTWTLENTSNIVDKLNEAWCDVDDWLFGPLFFWEYESDGTTKPKDDKPTLGREEVEKTLFDLGFKRSDGQTEMLDRLFQD